MSSSVTLRFYVSSVTENAGGYHACVLQPSYANGANAEWSKYTPSGRIELNLSADAGVEFYVDALRNKKTIEITMTVAEE